MQLLANDGTGAIGTNQDVRAFRTPVPHGEDDARMVDLESHSFAVQRQRPCGRRLEERAVQRRSQSDYRGGACCPRGNIESLQQSSATIPQLHIAYGSARRDHALGESKLPQCLDRIGCQIERESQRPGLRGTFKDADTPARSLERDARRQPANAGADDQCRPSGHTVMRSG